MFTRITRITVVVVAFVAVASADLITALDTETEDCFWFLINFIRLRGLIPATFTEKGAVGVEVRTQFIALLAKDSPLKIGARKSDNILNVVVT